MPTIRYNNVSYKNRIKL